MGVPPVVFFVRVTSSRLFRASLVAVAIGAMLGCTPGRFAGELAASGPITSAGDLATAVPVAWSPQTGGGAGGARLLVEGGNLHAIPEEMRLLAAGGRTVARAPALPLPDGAGLCGSARGLARAELPLPATELERFRKDEWPATYRLELRVGGRWRPTLPVYAGCESTG